MLHKILETNGDLPDRCQVVFANTGREMPETLDFVEECSQRWDVPITWVEFDAASSSLFRVVNYRTASRNGEPFEDIIRKARRLPDAVRRFCTKELKIFPAKRYLRSLGWKNWNNAIGIRADEKRRVKPAKGKHMENWFPLVADNVRKDDIAEFWGKQLIANNFDLHLDTTSNCDGCFLKSEANRAAMFRAHPERMQWWVEMERQMQGNFIFGQPYGALGDFVDRQTDWIFDDLSYFCQADGGECTG
jgi:3'-phosphoadenosine 5'-phosphosulfate sulfotransferase (PAPS reductase)/FAD synthetase